MNDEVFDPRSEEERSAMDAEIEEAFELQGLRPVWDEFTMTFCQ